jgi:hypothetical protein
MRSASSLTVTNSTWFLSVPILFSCLTGSLTQAHFSSIEAAQNVAASHDGAVERMTALMP